LKLTDCTSGQTIQFFFNASPYVLCSFAFGLEPSRYAILLRKTRRLVEAKMVWSARTRAAIVALVFLKFIFAWRNLYQSVAAGPKTTGKSRLARPKDLEGGH